MSLAPFFIPFTVADTTWLPTTVVDEFTPCDAFLTGNSTGELYTVNAIVTCCSPAIVSATDLRRATFHGRTLSAKITGVCFLNSQQLVYSSNIFTKSPTS